jgi:4-hydroxy-3-methylbut-2-enyl diphosphate reductase
MGVKRAVDMAYRAREKSAGAPVVTLGPLIHNQPEIERLAVDAINVASLDTLPAAGTVIIRAHGVAPQAFAQLRARGLRVLDATCPYVHYSQRKAVELRDAGYQVVIAGNPDHPEIAGILGHVNHEALVIENAEQARNTPACDRIGVIAQTTLSPQKYKAIVAALTERAREVKVCATICDATEQNQAAIHRLAAEVEMLYVVGDRQSANSNKLVETARAVCPRVRLIETPAQIEPEELRGAQRVGVSAGASTPDWMIKLVVERLRELDRQAQR